MSERGEAKGRAEGRKGHGNNYDIRKIERGWMEELKWKIAEGGKNKCWDYG